MVKSNYLRLNVKILNMLRIYHKNGTRRELVADFIIIFLFNTLFVCASISLGLNIKKTGMSHIESNALSYAFFVASISVVQKCIYYWVNRNKFENLVFRVNEIFKFTSNTLLEEKNIQCLLKVVNKVTIFWIVNGQILSIVIGFIPIVLQRSNESRILPLSMWVPCEWKASPMYEVTYFFEISFLMASAFVETATSMFFVAVILLTSGQFMILGWEFKNLLYTNLIKSGIPRAKVYEFRKQFNSYDHKGFREIKGFDFKGVLNLIKSRKFNEDMLKSGHKLVVFHQSLLSFCEDLQEFFSPLMLIHYMIVAPILVFINFVLITTDGRSTRFIYLPLCITGYLEVLFPCFIANILTIQAENLAVQLYELPWYILSKEFNTIYKILALKMSVPVTLTVGGVVGLNLRLFLWILRTLNSYSLMMYQLNQPH